jgi:ATP-binding cassette, subfamily B, multidrug efflux pump
MAGPLRGYRRMLPYFRRYRRGLAGGMALVVVSNAFGAALPWLLGRAIDGLAGAGVTLGAVAGSAGLIVVAALVSGAARFGMRQKLNGISRSIENDVRDDFFDQLLRLDAAFYGARRTGDLMSRATNDTQAVRMAIGPGIMYLVNTVVMTAFVLAVMVSYSLSLTLIALVPLAFLPPVMVYFGRAIHRRFEKIQDHLGVLSTMVQENLSGVRIVRAYNQERAQEREFDELNTGYLEKNMALARTAALFSPLLTLLTGFGILTVLWFGGRQAIAGTITAGDFVAFFFYLALLAWPMIALGWVINLFQRGAASLQRIAAVMDAQPAVAPPTDALAPAEVLGRIELRDVSFRYPGTERDVLRDVSFVAEAGQTIAIVGPTGAGKSTLVALLARRFDPNAGEVLLDGVPLRRLPFDVLRRAIALVPQDAFVFSDTIRNNIALGLPVGGSGGDTLRGDATARIEEAARVAQLTETIHAFPAGFETRLGERGVNLSGGQRQRATLARAIARDAAVLILDDALSAVDTHTETRILRGLRAVFARRTAFIISHRVSAVMNADLILVLDDGRIVERGSHADLLAHGGLYASLLHRQLLAEDLDGAPLAAAETGI